MFCYRGYLRTVRYLFDNYKHHESISYQCFRNRLVHCGWSVHRALTEVVR